jgi:hypothetical protein
MIPLWVWRIAPYALGVVIVVVAAMGALHNAKEEGRAELEPQIKRLEAALAAERSDRARAEAAADSYRSEMDALRDRPVPRTPVRLCVTKPVDVPVTQPSTGSAIGTTTTTWGYNGTAAPDFEAGPDIGADLYDLAGRCDAEIAKLRALQGWVNDVR